MAFPRETSNAPSPDKNIDYFTRSNISLFALVAWQWIRVSTTTETDKAKKLWVLKTTENYRQLDDANSYHTVLNVYNSYKQKNVAEQNRDDFANPKASVLHYPEDPSHQLPPDHTLWYYTHCTGYGQIHTPNFRLEKVSSHMAGTTMK